MAMTGCPGSWYFRLTAALLAGLLAVFLCVDRPEKMERRIAERQAAGQTVPTHWYVPVWSWKGLVANLGLAALLVALTPLAARPRPINEPAQVPARPSSRWEWVILGGVVLFAAVQNAPRLDHSLWGDEEYTMKRLIADEVERGADGRLEFTPTPWTTTFWSFRKPTNHIGYTVVARTVHELFFHQGSGPADPWFSERLMRLPSYVAGLLSIGALAWACGVWGWRNGVVFVVPVYVLHPWFMRFGVDARAYGFVLLLAPLLIGLLGRALQTGQWRWWLALGTAQFLLFWSYFGAIYLLVMLNAAALLIFFGARASRAASMHAATRWLVANIATAMLVIALMAPCLPQLFEFLAQKPLPGRMDAAWFLDAACDLLSGVPWHPWDAANPLCEAWAQRLGGSNPFFVFAAALLVAAALAALVLGVRILMRDRQQRWLLLVILGAPALMLTHQALAGIRPYHWYLIPFLPGCFLLLAAALCHFDTARMQPAAVASRWATRASLFIIACLLPAQWVSQRERALLRKHPIEPCRESVALTRTVINPRHPDYDKDVITAGFSFYTEAYDPGMLLFTDVAGLRQLMERARQEKKRLFVNFGFRAWAELHFPEILAVLDDPAQFKHISTLPGLFHTSTREVYELAAP